MAGQVIGKTMTNGFAGAYSRQPDQIIDTRITGTGGLKPGDPVKLSTGTAVLMGGSSAATDFAGVAIRAVKTSDYGANTESYAAGEPVGVMKRGRIIVKCNVGTPALNGDVYVRITYNASVPDGVVGGFEASSDSTNSVKVTNIRWAGAKDANGMAELEILYPVNA